MLYLPVDTAVTVQANILPLVDDTDFKTIETSVAYNAAGMDMDWFFTTTGGVITTTAVTPTTSGYYDWTHMSGGMYKIEIPASGGASINNDVAGYGYFRGVANGIYPWVSPFYAFGVAISLDEIVRPLTFGTAQGGTSTTLQLASGAITQNDQFNDTCIVNIIAGTGAGQSRTITDSVASTDTVTVATWDITPNSTSVYQIVGSGDAASGSGPSAGTIADAVWDEARSGHTSAGSFGEGLRIESLNTAAKADVNAEADTAISDAALSTAAALATVDTVVDAIKVVTDNLPNSGSLNDLAAIKAITDLLTAVQAEPTGVPAVNESPLNKLARLYMAWRNKVTVTASKIQYYDDGDAVEFEKDLSDDSTTFTATEVNAP